MNRRAVVGAVALSAALLVPSRASAQVGEFPAAEGAPTTPVASAPVTTSASPTWPAFALAGVAGGGALLGSVLTIVGLSEEGSVAGVPCPGGAETCPDEVATAVDARNGLVAAGTTSFVVSGAAVIGLITYLAVGHDAPPPVEVVASPSGVGVSARIRF